jgi:hypothetical protein
MVVPVLARLLSTGRRGPLTRPPANPTSYPLGHGIRSYQRPKLPSLRRAEPLFGYRVSAPRFSAMAAQSGPLLLAGVARFTPSR